MSKIKSLVPEDYEPETVEPTIDGHEPTESEWALIDLERCIRTLEKETPYGTSDELDNAIARLMVIKAKVDKPF
jgi:hypothetical protein